MTDSNDPDSDNKDYLRDDWYGSRQLPTTEYWEDGRPKVSFITRIEKPAWDENKRPIKEGVDRPSRKGSGKNSSKSSSVGYRRPPPEHRFQPGQSGNPQGRPLGSKNRRPVLYDEPLSRIIKTEAYREITVREGDGHITLPMIQAVVRAISLNAAKGHIRAQKLFTEMVQRIEAREVQGHLQALETAITMKADLEELVAQREARGITDHSDLPLLPEDVHYDIHTGESGILSAEQKEAGQALAKVMAARRRMIADSVRLLAGPSAELTPKMRSFLKDSTAKLQAELMDQLAMMPPWILRLYEAEPEEEQEDLLASLAPWIRQQVEVDIATANDEEG